MPELRPEGFVEGVRKILRTLRYGPRELSVATLGLLLLALPTLLPKEPEFLKPVLAWLPWIGVLVLALAAWLIWRKVVAPVPDEGKPKPPAIKGPAPFGPHDADLFARLGRKDNLDRLRGWILDDQKPLVALMGESGVGKTSLLRAGLESHLKEDSVQVIYWEALPTDPEEGLLHAIRSHWENPSAAPVNFARLASTVARGKRVLVIDQAEQLSPDRHPGIFEMLRQVATTNPPYAATWVVAFRREYLPIWRDFELSLPEPSQRRLETLSLQRFSPEQAERVIAVLAEEGGLPLEQKVVKTLVEGIKSEDSVTPADIGISLLVLSGISGAGKDVAFTVEDFQERGGQAGLLERYLERLLKDFPEAERREIFQVLLSLIDLENDQRRAEGLTPLDLEKMARPVNPNRFATALRFLASGKARILEEVPEPPLRYRLIHERLIPAIRRLTGVLLAEAEQASRLLERTYRIWCRDRKAHYLLSGRELRHVLKFRDQLAWGADEEGKRGFILLARRHRNYFWVVVVTSIVIAWLAVYVYSKHKSQITSDRELLASWNLPLDTVDHLEGLRELSLPGVTRFNWLSKAKQLRILSVNGTDLPHLAELPQGLQTLEIATFITIEDIPAWPPYLNLRHLKITTSQCGKLTFPDRLVKLDITCMGPDPEEAFDFGSLKLPASLESLRIFTSFKLEGLDFSSFVKLRHLQVRQFKLGELSSERLPRSLKSLRLFNVNLLQENRLPSGLEFLSCDCNLEPTNLPKNLRRLEVRHQGPLKYTGPLLESLGTSTSNPPQPPLEGLSQLSLTVNQARDLPQLPSTLKILTVMCFGPLQDTVVLANLPTSLRKISVYCDTNVDFPKGLPSNLLHLTFGTGQTILPKLPENLRSLTYYGPLKSNLPASIRSLTIRLDGNDWNFLSSLSSLSRLTLSGEVDSFPVNFKSLEELDIRSTKIREMKKFPPNLFELTLRPGQFSSLEGLPESIDTLHFR